MDERTIDAVQSAPRWLERPSGQGLWLCQPSDEKQFLGWTPVTLEQADIDRGAPFYTKAVFGPIPEPPKETP